MDMAAMEFYDGDYLSAYRRFLEHFVANVCRYDDQLPVKMSHKEVRECEVVGEIADIALQHLNQRICPPSLQAYLVKLVIDECKIMFQKQPEECGYRPQEKKFSSLKLMQAVTNKVNEICQRYLDNSRLALLPPPPSTPLPLTSSFAIKNKRRKMEDRSVVLHDLHTMFSIKNDAVVNYYAVFDGHGGQEAAIYCASHLHQYLVESPYYPADPELALRDAFSTTDSRFIECHSDSNCGSTAVCALLYDKTLYVAWAGDSQAALIRNGTGIDLTSPHKPQRKDEQKRIEDLGGQIIHYGTWRVNGILNVSRSLGDAKYKPYVSGEPEIKKIELDGTEDALIIACDGFWERANEQIAASLLYEYVSSEDCNYSLVSSALVNWARTNLSLDNISVIVVYLTPPSEIAAKYYVQSRPAPNSAMEPGYVQSEQQEQPHQQQQPYELDYFASKQPLPEPAQANGNDVDHHFMADGNAVLEPRNGTHRAKPPKYNGMDDDEDEDDEDEEEEEEEEEDFVDLGPETNVDAVDDVMPGEFGALDQAMGQNFPDEFVKKQLADAVVVNREDIDDFSMDDANKRHQNELIPESDNVADSEDSEDEWNYYRPNESNGTASGKVSAEAEATESATAPPAIVEPENGFEIVPDHQQQQQQQQPSKDPALVEKTDQCEEEKESCSPKPYDDEYNDNENENAELVDNVCEDKHQQQQQQQEQAEPTSASAEQEPDADDVTAEYDELHDFEPSKELPPAELHKDIVDTDAEATIPEEDLPFDQDQQQPEPLQSEEPSPQLEEHQLPQEPAELDQQLEEREQPPFEQPSFEQPLQSEEHQLPQEPVELDQQLEEREQPPFEQPLQREEQSEQQQQQPQPEEKLLDEDDEDMESHLNPDAAEFVPTSIPSHVTQGEGDLIAGSPLKQSQRALKSQAIPSEEEFKEEICHRPSEIDDSLMSDYSNGSCSPQKNISTDLLACFTDEKHQTVLPTSNLLDDSEISSTKAEYGDESTFSVAGELQKTGYSNMDFSCTGSERGDFDFNKDAMTTSMTPGDFKNAFEQEPDLNKVHELKDEDLGDIQSGSYEEEERMDVEAEIDDLTKDNIELDLENLVPQQEQNIDAFSAVVEQRESDNKDLFMNLRNIEHDLLQPGIAPLENSKSDDIPAYADNNPFADDVELCSAQVTKDLDLEKITDEFQKVEIKEEQEQPLFDNDSAFKSEESAEVQKDVRNEVMHNPLELNFNAPPAEPKLDEPVLVSPYKEPEIMSSKFEEENLMSQSVEALNSEQTAKPEFEAFSQNNYTVVEQPLHDESPLAPIAVQELKQQEYTEPKLLLSESLQEFTGLEEQLSPATEEKENAQQPEEPQTLKESLVDEPKDVEEIIPAPVADVKVKETPVVTNAASIVSNERVEEPAASSATPVAAAAAVVAATVVVTTAATAAAAATKPSPKAAASKTSKPGITSKVGSKSTTPTSPTKAGIAAKTGASTAAARKPTTAPRASMSKPSTGPAAPKPASSMLSKTSAAAKSSTTASKPTGTTANKITRTSTAPSAKPKLNAVASKIGSLAAEKKPTTNGDVKPTGAKPPPISRLAPRPSAPSTTTSKMGLVKSTTSTRTSVSSTAAARAPRPATATSTTKPASSRVSSTVSSSTGASAARPKTAPTSTLNSIKSKVGVGTAKSPVTDKQIKDTANKQISSARTATSTLAKSRLSTVTSSTTTTTRRMSLAPKAPAAGAASSPARKPISKPGAAAAKSIPSKITSKISSTTKSSSNTVTSTTTTETKIVENGVKETESIAKLVENAKIENDIGFAKDNPHNDIDRLEDNVLISVKD